LQQPFGQVVPSQTHEPPRHCWPEAQGAPEPHWHAPVAEQPSDVVGSQAVQAFPPAPHAETEIVVVQVPPFAPPSQHPEGHDAALQTHSPAEHTWPGPHGALAPHAHAPVAEQLSATALSQATQVPPAAPQLETDRAAHVDPMQQSPGQDAASQMHWPPAHLCPATQAGPLPQAHSPCEEQLSARLLSQAVQAPPFLPHAATEGALHSLPAQHPSVHLAVQLLHAPEVHVSPMGHALHAPPPAPHAPGVLPGSHVDPLQHPVGHDLASQTAV
jgi:hypothetical protein